jgi:hypothetical protein
VVLSQSTGAKFVKIPCIFPVIREIELRLASGRLQPPPCSLVSVLSLRTETTFFKHFKALRDTGRAIAPQKPTATYTFSGIYSKVSNG